MANRHDVIIWDANIYGIEKEYKKIVRQARALVNQKAEPSHSILLFAQYMYLESDLKNLEPTVVHYLQHFEEMIKSTKTAAIIVELPEDKLHAENILKILLRETRRHGLVLCDQELELVVFPDGTILPTSLQTGRKKPSKDTKDTKDFPVTLKQFHEFLKAQLDTLLRIHNFILAVELDEDDDFGVIYDKIIKMGKLSIAIGYQGGNGEFKIGIRFQIIEDNMIAIAKKSDFSFSMIGGGGIAFQVLEAKKIEKTRINNWQTFEELLSLLKNSVLRWSDNIEDINGIDALINGNIDKDVKNEVYSYLYTPYALIVAWLVNNPRFDELAVSLGTYGANSGRTWGKFSHAQVAEAWPKLVQYLRDEVKPLI